MPPGGLDPTIRARNNRAPGKTATYRTDLRNSGLGREGRTSIETEDSVLQRSSCDPQVRPVPSPVAALSR